MKRSYLIPGLLFFIATFFSAQIWAVAPQKISCTSIDKNLQCEYKVLGEDSHDFTKASKLYLNTNMPYALCSNSKCKFDKKNVLFAECPCLVFGLGTDRDAWQRASVGPLSYALAKPVMTEGEITSLTSTYSSANMTSFSNTNSITCNSSEPVAWANCFGAKCSLNANGKTAVCQCPVIKSTSFVSVGPSSKSQCKLSSGEIWSAATEAQDENNNFIIKNFYESKLRDDYKL